MAISVRMRGGSQIWESLVRSRAEELHMSIVNTELRDEGGLSSKRQIEGLRWKRQIHIWIFKRNEASGWREKSARGWRWVRRNEFNRNNTLPMQERVKRRSLGYGAGMNGPLNEQSAFALLEMQSWGLLCWDSLHVHTHTHALYRLNQEW